jgi:hypothetical protein
VNRLGVVGGPGLAPGLSRARNRSAVRSDNATHSAFRRGVTCGIGGWGAAYNEGDLKVSNSSDVSARSGPLGFIRSPRDFWGGVGLIALALIAWWASRDLPGQQGFAFGPGTAPRIFMFLLGLNGAGIVLIGLLSDGPQIEKWAFRGPLFVLGAVLVFAATIRPLGLIISTFLLVVISAAGTREVRWIEITIWGAVLAAFCAVLFPYALNLPMQLWPRF